MTDISAPDLRPPDHDDEASKAIPSGFIEPDDRPPIYQPGARSYIGVPGEEIDIDPPRPDPVPPSISLFSILWPIGAIFLILGLLSQVQFGQALLKVGRNLFSVPELGIQDLVAILGGLGSLMVIVPRYLGTWYQFFRERRRYSEDVAQREQHYRDYLKQRRERLERLRAAQLNASLMVHPPVDECLMRAAQRHSRLWERSPGDDDFLEVRLGVGRAPPSFTIKPALGSLPSSDTDPLLKAASDLANEFASVDGMPITLPLARIGAVGIVGQRGMLHGAIRCLLIQLATHHPPSDLKIALIFSQPEWDEWIWARWLPHVWSDDRSRRYMADTPDAAYQLLSELGDLLNNRQPTADPSGGRRTGPAIVLVLSEHNEEMSRFPGMIGRINALSRSRRSSVHTIFVADQTDEIPRSCRASIELAEGSGHLGIGDPTSPKHRFTPDTIDQQRAGAFARALAPLRLLGQADSSGLPTVLPLLDLLGARQIEDLSIAELWRQTSSSDAVEAPIGLLRNRKQFVINLHERGQGTHALIAGDSRAGKSVLLQTLIASLAVRYHPHELAFILFDFKGDGFAQVFQELPHQVGIITTIAGGMTGRAIDTLRAIFQRRQYLFQQAGVNNIDSYIRAYRQKKIGVPLPHLLIVIDEFGDIARHDPNFMSDLITLVQANRALGGHLLLSTAWPAEVIDERIWNILPLRLCLRTERVEDSQRVIGGANAAALQQPGRGYVRVNRSNFFDLFQTAWAGAPYNPTGTNDELIEVDEVDLAGRRQRLGLPVDQFGPTQLEALVALLKQAAQREQVVPLVGPWLSPPSEMVTVESMRRGVAEGWDGSDWLPSSSWLAPTVGLVDDPVRRFQGPLQVALGDGPLAIYGPGQSGKTTLLKSIVTSLVLSHPPSQVHLHLLDVGDYLARIFRALPHVVCASLPEEVDQINTMVYTLLVELDRRKDLIASISCDTIVAYRKQVGDTIPDIVLVLDHYAQLVALFPSLIGSLERIADEGRRLGISLILAAHSDAEPTQKLRASLAQTIRLGTNAVNEQSVAGHERAVRLSEPALLLRSDTNAAPLLFQKALPAPGATDADRDEALRGIGRAMGFAWHGLVARDALRQPDLYDPYEIGLRQLLSQLAPDSQEYSNALVYQQRLLENITQSRLYGDTDERESDRAEIIHRLTDLTRSELGVSFRALCGLLNTVTR